MTFTNLHRRSPIHHLLGLLLTLCTLVSVAGPALAQSQTPPLAEAEIRILGLSLEASPSFQTVPKNTTTAVNVGFRTAPDQVLPSLPGDAQIVAELRGPSLPRPQQLSARFGELLLIPPLPLKGVYVVENIRLQSGGQTLLQAVPDSVSLEVIDKILASQVTTRNLSENEIEDLGIFIDQENFSAVEFTVGIGVQENRIPISFPMLVPRRDTNNPRPVRPPKLPKLNPATIDLDQGERIVLEQPLTNLGISGFMLECSGTCGPETAKLVPPIPGVLVFPGNIGFLNQFFNATLLVSNIAPGNSNLVVRDVQAEIILPAGKDNVAGSGDDPLRMARFGSPPAEQNRVQPVRQPGPDGQLGTADDVNSLPPQQDGQAEYIVEGRREGVHTVDVKISAILDGLPIGPVPISGRAVGTVEVRNPSFTLTFNHPLVVSNGEAYDFFVTVTNISDVPATYATIGLSPRSISGAQLLSEEVVQVESIPPGDSATARFRMLSLQSGRVIATSLASADTPGKFELTMAVGELGIPLSPNTLIMPGPAYSLPRDLLNAGVALLSQAHALATSPVTPEGLLPMGRQIVYDRAVNLATGGQRLSLGEPLLSVAQDLALDFAGNDLVLVQEPQTQKNYQAFDLLARQSARGAAFGQALGVIFAQAANQQGALAFQTSFARQAVSRPPHLSAVTAGLGGSAPVLLSLTGPKGGRLGAVALDGQRLREIPYGDFYDLAATDPLFSQMALLSTLDPGIYRVELRGTGMGNFDLGVTVPERILNRALTPQEFQLRSLTFTGVPLQSGGRAWLELNIGGINDYILHVDGDGDGVEEQILAPTTTEIVPDLGPQVVSAIQLAHLDQFGRMMGVLFNEEIAPAGAQSGLAAERITNFQIEANQALATAVQPSNRVVLLFLRDGIGPFIPRTITVANIQDRLGHPMDPISVTVPISPTITRMGGTVAGQVQEADGTPVANALVTFRQKAPRGEKVEWQTVTVKSADGEGRFGLDYVSDFPSSFSGTKSETGERNTINTQVRYQGQHMDLNIVLQGTGTLVGRALALNGQTPLPDTLITMESLGQLGVYARTVSDASGAFLFNRVPVGPVNLSAVHNPTNSRVQLSANIPVAGAVIVQDLLLIPQRQAVQRTGSLIGQVLRADGVTPAEDVPVFTNQGGLTRTDGDGRYRLDDLPVGSIKVEAVDQVQLESASVQSTVVADSAVTANLILFGGSGTVRGIVRDADGDPVAGAKIGGGPQFEFTDADGTFTLNDVPIGRRTIQALLPDTDLLAKTTVNLARPGEEATVQITLPAYGTIVGRVYQADGITPVRNLDLTLLGQSSNLYFARTDQNGAYRVDHVLTGAYIISAFRPDFKDGNFKEVRLVFHKQIVAADVSFRGKGQVHVQVLDDDGVTPVAARLGLTEQLVLKNEIVSPDNTQCRGNVQIGDIVVELTPCRSVAVAFYSQPVNRIADTDPAAGSYLFEDVFVGDVTVQAVSPFGGGASRGTRISRAGATTYMTLTLQSTGEVSGTVFQPDGVTPVGADVLVKLDSRTLRDVRVVTDEEGHFRFPLVNPGSFAITAEDPISGLQGQSGGSVRSGGLAAVSVRLLGKGTVRAEVVGRTGAPIVNAPLSLRRGVFPVQTLTGITDATGHFTFTNRVWEGRFSVSATDPVGGGQGFQAGTMGGPGQTTQVRVVVPDEFGTVQGHFLQVDGLTPIPNAAVTLVSNFDGREAFAATDADGAFVFAGVPKSGFSLEAQDFVSGRQGQASGQIESHQQVVTVTLTQNPVGTVAGVVLSSVDGSPMAGAAVAVNTFGRLPRQITSSSGPDGSYRVEGVPGGPFRVTASQGGFSGRADGSIITEGEIVTKNVTIQVQPPQIGRIEGTVFKADGSPSRSAQVSLPYARTVRRTTVDDNGRYAFDNVPLMSFAVTAEDQVSPDGGRATGSLIYNGETAQVDIHMLGLGRVEGLVQNGAGNPVPFATVDLRRQGSNPRTFSAQTLSDAQGRFVVDPVLIGNLSASARDGGSGLGGSANGQVIVGQTLAVTITLQAAGSITGRILRQDGVTPAEGMAVELTGSGRRFDGSDADGRFRFDDLPLATYQIEITDPLGEGLARTEARLTAQGQLIDLGDLILDEAAPQVMTITPADGTGAVPVEQVIQVDFSEPVDGGTVTNRTLLVSGPSGAIPGSRSTVGARVFFTPTQPLPDLAVITVKVTQGVQDRVGKPIAAESVTAFTTADTTPPQITSLSPGVNGANVALESVIRVTFGEAVQSDLFTPPAIQLSQAGLPVAGRIDFTQNNSVLIFTPNAPLTPNRVYSVTVQPATDSAGNRQTAPTLYTFSTLDVVAPVIRSLTAVGGNTVIRGGTAHLIADLEPADDILYVEFLIGDQVRLSDSQPPYGFDLTLTPELGEQVTVVAQATDRAGNVSAQARLTLTIRADRRPTVLILTPGPEAGVAAGVTIPVTVQAVDDVGITGIFLQASGPMTANLSQPINGSPSVTRTFQLNIPAALQRGESILLQANATDSQGQAGPAESIQLPVTGDAVAPSLQISQPTQGAVVRPGDTVTITVTAQDNQELARVVLRVSGAVSQVQTRTLSGGVAAATTLFTVTVPTQATGLQSLQFTAQATDWAGNPSPNAQISLGILDIFPPQVELTISPAGERVVESSTVRVTVTGTDEVGVAGLGFQVSGLVTISATHPLQPSQLSASHTFTFTAPSAALLRAAAANEIQILATATDGAGNFAASSPITRTVVAPGGVVSGTVRGVDGQPVAGVDVTVEAVNATLQGSTNANGDYQLAPVAPGPITATAVDPATGRDGSAQAEFGPFDTVLVVDMQITAPPVVTITQPISGALFFEGEAIQVVAEAVDDLGIRWVEFLVDGQVTSTDQTPPYQFETVAPTAATQVVLAARATDQEGKERTDQIQLQIQPDPLTTVQGRVVDVDGNPLAGATATVLGHTATSGADGVFSISSVPTIQGNLRVDVRITLNAVERRGSSPSLPPVAGGVTHAGDIVVRDKVLWDGGGDGVSWHDPANWNGDLLPGPLDDVIISVAANPTINVVTGTHAIRTLVTDESLHLSGGTLQISDTLQANGVVEVRGGELVSATVSGQFQVGAAGGRLSGVTLRDMTVSIGHINGTNTAVQVRNGLTLANSRINLGRENDCEFGRLDFVGSQSLGGTGTIHFANFYNPCADRDNQRNGLRVVQDDTVLTIGPAITVQGADGFIGYSDVYKGPDPNTIGVIFQGTLRQTDVGGSFSLWARNWVNDNALFHARDGAIYLTNVTITNTNVLSVAGGQLIRFANSGVVGGMVASAENSAFTFIDTANLLDGVTLDGMTLYVGNRNSEPSGVVAIRNGLALQNSRINLGRENDCEVGRLDFVGSQTLGGTGTIHFANFYNPCADRDNQRNGLRVVQDDTVLTIGPAITVQGADGFIGYSDVYKGPDPNTLGVIFQGKLHQTDVGGSFSLWAKRWVNDNALFHARDGAIYLTNVTITNTNVLSVAGGQLIRFANSGVVGGVVASAEDSAFTFIDTANQLDGVTLDGMTLHVGNRNSEPSGVVAIRNGLTLQDSRINLGRENDCEVGYLNFVGSQSLGGTGTIHFADFYNPCADRDNQRNGLRVVQDDTVLTIGPEITVQGADGFIGYSDVYKGPNPNTIGVVSQGALRQTDVDGSFSLWAGSWVNDNGLFQARDGAIYLTNVTITNTNVLSVAGGQLIRFSNSGVAGGVVASAENSAFTFINTANRLDGVTLDGMRLNVGVLNSEPNGAVTIRNGLTLNNGRINLGRETDCEVGRLDFVGSQILGGNGSIRFADFYGPCADRDNQRNGLRVVQDDTVLTIGPEMTVLGVDGFIGYSAVYGGSQAVDGVNQGRIVSNGGGSLLLNGRRWTNAGVLEQAGASLSVVGQLTNRGQVRPGLGGGVLAVTGSYTQTTEGSLLIQIQGPAVGSQYSRLQVSGGAALAGEVAIQRGATYTPSVGTAFQILQAASRSGEFDTVTGAEIGNGDRLTISYGGSHATLTVAGPGSSAPTWVEDQDGIRIYLPTVLQNGAAQRASSPADIIYLPVLSR